MFIKFSHHDIRCIIDALEEVPLEQRTEQENKTLEKAKLILEAQKLAATRSRISTSSELVQQES